MQLFAPLLSADADIKKNPDALNNLVFPLWVSPKLDGIRCVVRDKRCVSRKLIDLPSKQVQELFSHLEHMDGELIVGDATDPDVYNRTQSYVMSGNKPADQITFYVFDWAEETWAQREFLERFGHLDGYVQRYQSLYPEHEINLVLVEHTLVRSLEELLAFEEKTLAEGYEGIMMRRGDGPYRVPRKAKENRSTLKEQILIKFKRFEDIEARVVGFVEGERNENAATKDNLGHTKRSTAKAGMVPSGTVGKFLVEYEGKTHTVARGFFKKPQLQEMFDNQSQFLGRLLKVRHFPHGAKDGLRHPRAVGWRSAIDL